MGRDVDGTGTALGREGTGRDGAVISEPSQIETQRASRPDLSGCLIYRVGPTDRLTGRLVATAPNGRYRNSDRSAPT